MTLQNPASVVLFLEFDQCLPQLLEGFEGPHLEQVLLEDPDEPFGATVPLGLADERRELRIPRNASSPWNASESCVVP